jgi:hypothetical protein
MLFASTQYSPQYCDRDDKKFLFSRRFNRTIKLMIQLFLRRMNTNRWIENIKDFVNNYNSSYHSGIKKIPERLEIFDEVDLISNNCAHNNKKKSIIKIGDFVRLLNKRRAFEKDILVKFIWQKKWD